MQLVAKGKRGEGEKRPGKHKSNHESNHKKGKHENGKQKAVEAFSSPTAFDLP
jgi:hypothetical protein